MKPKETPKIEEIKPIIPTEIVQPKEVPKDVPKPVETPSEEEEEEGVEGGVEGGIEGGVLDGVGGEVEQARYLGVDLF